MIVADERVARFVSEKLGFGLCPPWTSMGIEKNGEIIAGVVFNSFEGADVHVTVAGTGWTKTFLQEVGRYVYSILGCDRMTITTEQDSIVSIAQRLGGQIEGRLRNHFGKGRDGMIVGILREEYRFYQADGGYHQNP